MTDPITSGWGDRRVGLSPTEKRRLWTGHVDGSRSGKISEQPS
jgi:hypothetical protein